MEPIAIRAHVYVLGERFLGRGISCDFAVNHAIDVVVLGSRETLLLASIGDGVFHDGLLTGPTETMESRSALCVAD